MISTTETTTTQQQIWQRQKMPMSQIIARHRKDNIFSGIICSMQIATKTSAIWWSPCLSSTNMVEKSPQLQFFEKITEMTKMVENHQNYKNSGQINKNHRNYKNGGKITESKLCLSLGLLEAWSRHKVFQYLVDIDFILASEKKSSRWPNGHSGLVGKSRWCFLKPQYEQYDLILIFH